MDALLAAIVNILNTGSALAPTALYLFFGYKVASALSFSLFIFALTRGIKGIVVAALQASSTNRRLAAMQDVFKQVRYSGNPGAEVILAQLKEINNAK